MTGLRNLIPGCLLICCVLGWTSAAVAGPLDWLFPDDHRCHCYPASRYWLPGLAHCHDNKEGPKLQVYPPNRHPEIPPYCLVLKYPCPSAAPAQTIITPPSPSR